MEPPQRRWHMTVGLGAHEKLGSFSEPFTPCMYLPHKKPKTGVHEDDIFCKATSHARGRPLTWGTQSPSGSSYHLSPPAEFFSPSVQFLSQDLPPASKKFPPAPYQLLHVEEWSRMGCRCLLTDASFLQSASCLVCLQILPSSCRNENNLLEEEFYPVSQSEGVINVLPHWSRGWQGSMWYPHQKRWPHQEPERAKHDSQLQGQLADTEQRPWEPQTQVLPRFLRKDPGWYILLGDLASTSRPNLTNGS